MQLEHSFTVPVGIDDAWKVLLDIERVAPCMPGAALETVHGDDFTGTVKVKLGPIALTYKGKASFVEKDESAHRATIHAQGRDARGNGTASAKVTATLTDQSGETKVDVVTDLDITGKPAQFGRGVMVDVGNKLIGQFADCLAGKLSGGGAAGEAAAPAAPAAPVSEPVAEAAAAPAAQPAKKTAAKKTPAKKAPAKKTTTAKKTAAAASSPPAASAPVDEAPSAPVEPSANGTAELTTPSEPSAPSEPPAATEPAASPTEPATVPTTEPVAAPVSEGPRQIAPTEVEPIDLLEHAGPAVAKRLAPVVAVLILLLIILRLRKR